MMRTEKNLAQVQRVLKVGEHLDDRPMTGQVGTLSRTLKRGAHLSRLCACLDCFAIVHVQCSYCLFLCR